MSDGETTKTKVVNLKKLCNFVVHNFFISSCFDDEKFDSQNCIELIPKESICSIVTSECVVVGHDLGWRTDENKSCRSQKVTQLCI
jgi:hypothetical protein